MELDKTAHGENINDVLSKTESVAVFTDGSALGNPGPTGSGAVIYYHGQNKNLFVFLNIFVSVVTTTLVHG